MNYLNYFNIPKFLYAGRLPSTGNRQKDSELSHMQKLYKNEGLSTELTPEAFLIDGTILGKPFEWAGKGLLAGAKYIAPKTTGYITKGIDYVKHFVKSKRHGIIKKTGNIEIPQAVEKPKIKLPEYSVPNYKGDHLALAKERLSTGGYERIENPSLSLEALLTREPEIKQMIPGEPHTFFTGSAGKTFSKPELYKLPTKASSTEEITYMIDKLTYNTLNRNNQAVAHEFEHFVHNPKLHLSDAIVDHRYIPSELRAYFSTDNDAEIAARFGQLKNYFGLKENQPITKEMWEYAKLNYITDTGMNNNMVDFFNLPITDLLKFLDWGNKHALGISTPIGVGLYGTRRNKSIQSSE